MKKIRLALCLILVMLACMLCCAAQAAGNPVNPYYEKGRVSVPEMTSRGVTVSIETVNTPVLGGTGAWSVSVSGVSGAYSCDVYMCDDQYQYDDPSMLNTNALLYPNENGYYTFWFVAPGDYTLFVQVFDGGNNFVGWETYDFTVKPAAGYPSMDTTIQNIVAKCNAACSTDYEKAVWLHDYLVDNAEYDYSYTYYSVDGVLLRGTGVCDSYRKAYEKLLLAAGIEAVSVDGEGHAWNQVKLNGEWCNVDVTWDDPKGGNGKTFSRYSYFGLPTDIMEVDHVFEEWPRECTSCAQHYFIRSGFVDLWTEGFVSGINSALGKREWSFALDAPSPYPIGGGLSWGREHIVYGLTAYALENSEWMVNGCTVEIQAGYDADASVVRFDVLFDGKTLTLPAGLVSVEAEAFKGDDGFMAVIIPDGAQKIGSGAFSGCENLWKVVIPDSVTDIAEDAFDGCENVTIVCSAGSKAETFAKANGLRTLIG